MRHNWFWIIGFTFLLISFSGCNLRKENDYYIAKKVFIDNISNRISKSKLDSIINSLPYWRLDRFKTTNFHESLAVDLLKDNLKSKGLNTNEFIIYEIKIENDGIVTFHLNHIDYFVYRYNFEKFSAELAKKTDKNGYAKEVLPMTGNVSGHEGWYSVDFNNKEIEISYAQ